MSFKVGDKVRISMDSDFYGVHTDRNTIGTIILIHNSGHRYKVLWNNGTGIPFHYNKEDLEYWYKQPLEELCIRMSIIPGSNGDFFIINELYNEKEQLSGDHIKICRNMWEKYNRKS